MCFAGCPAAEDPALFSSYGNMRVCVNVWIWWSVGCIFAGLLGMRQGTRIEDRGPLFPGSSCFPLSPDQRDEFSIPHDVPEHDQLNMIFNVLGTPDPIGIDQLEREAAKRYIRSFAARECKGLHFPGVHSKAMHLLRRMLPFNPSGRMSAAEALHSEWFKPLRCREVSAPDHVTLDFEKEPEMDERRLRESFWKEITKFHKRDERKHGYRKSQLWESTGLLQAIIFPYNLISIFRIFFLILISCVRTGYFL
eukprot:s3912_g6.t1